MKESFNAKVIELLKYDSFDLLFKDFEIDLLADKTMTKKELKEELEKYYSKEKQNLYGVLGIRVEICKK